MPIEGIAQPEIIMIGPDLRLRRFGGEFSFALKWYSDPELVYLVDGNREPYTPELLERMYRWLDAHGELYFIEYNLGGGFLPIGDVTFSKGDMPIVIGEPDLRGRGIGRRVIRALSERARELGYEELFVREIYSWNEGSRRCFEAAGFTEYEPTEKGSSYRLRI